MPLNPDLPVLSDSEILRVFRDFDLDNSGDLTLSEFEIGVQTLRLPLSRRDIRSIIELADTDQDGKISLSEFTTFAKSQDLKIRLAFSALDLDSDHRVSSYEMRTALRRELGLEASSKELSALMRSFTSHSDTAIRFDEFRHRLLLLPAINTRRIYELSKPTHAIDIGEDFLVPNDSDGEDDNDGVTQLNTFISGGICGAISRTATAPADRVKVLFQSGAMEKGAGIAETVRAILGEGGLRAFWRGNGANVIKIAPESACKFMAYDALKRNRMIVADPDNPRMYERLMAGGMAGATAQTMIYPMEIAKTRLALARSGEYRGIVHCIQTIVSQNGFGALYKGWAASIAGIIPYAGVDLAVYNAIKDMRAKKRQREQHRGQQFQQTEPPAIEILATGSLSSVSGQLVAYPMQVMRTQLQSQGQSISLKLADGSVVTKTCAQYSGFLDCARQTLARDGLCGFYKGIAPNFMKTVPAISISYLVFEKTKLLLKDKV